METPNESEHLPMDSVEVLEREISVDKVVGLKEVIGNTPEGAEDFAVTEDLVSSAIFSNVRERRENCIKALSRFWETPVRVYKMTTPDEIYAYLTFNGIEDGFLFIGSYQNMPHNIEQAPTQRELDAFK